MALYVLRRLTVQDSAWVEQFTTEHWGDAMIIVHGMTYYAHHLPGFVAMEEGKRWGW